jgi:hypothetical protein
VTDLAGRGMAAIGCTVAAGSALSPQAFLRLFGIEPDQVTGAAALGWRLFAVRTGYISALAWRGDSWARAAFLPVHALDQVVFWHAFVRRSIPPPRRPPRGRHVHCHHRPRSESPARHASSIADRGTLARHWESPSRLPTLVTAPGVGNLGNQGL